jgi:hypothetical protein
MPLGVQFAQLLHAAGESAHLAGQPIPDGTYALALAAKDEATLLSIHGELLQLDIQQTLIREPDAPYFAAAMALGLSPMLRSQLPKFLRKLPLLGGRS